MNVIKSMTGGHCPLCDSPIDVGQPMTSYFQDWSHVECVVADFMTREEHSPGVTYILQLEDGCLKIGFSGTEKGVKQRIKDAYQTKGPVADVISLLNGGQSLEFQLHYTFAHLAEGRSEVFYPHGHIKAIARKGADHPYLEELRLYLEKYKKNQ